MSDEMKMERRNVYINQRRTTMAMERYFWTMLDGICFVENKTADDILTAIDNARTDQNKLTSSVRYIINKTIKIQHESGSPSDDLAEDVLLFPSPFHQAMDIFAAEQEK